MRMTVEDRQVLAALTPMWQRIERGEVDLSQYTDEEIESGRITMADGRQLPTPPRLPDTWVAEQKRRGLRKVEQAIRRGAVKAPGVLLEIMDNDMTPAKDRVAAAKIFLDRFMGTAPQHVHLLDEREQDPREELLQRLLAARRAVAAPTQPELPIGEVHEAEIVEADVLLEDVL